jgi:hypothetical protein
MEEIPNQSKMERGSHGLRRNAGFDGGFNGNKFFVFQYGRHGGENSRPRTAMKSQFSCRALVIAVCWRVE